MSLANCLEPVWSSAPGWARTAVMIDGYLGLAGGLALSYKATAAKKYVQKTIIPNVLDKLAENKYDEALLRTYQDKANGYVRKLVFALMYSSLASLWVMNFTKAAAPSLILAISMFFTGSFHYRYKDSMDSEKDFPYLGREFYRFYPFINESDCFRRGTKMEEITELENKAGRVIARAQHNLVVSLGTILATTVLFMSAVASFTPLGGIKAGGLGDGAMLGLMFATHSPLINANFSKVFSDLQCFLSIVLLRRPMYAVDGPPFLAELKTFEAMDSNLKVGHYWHSMRAFPPWNKVLHRDVFLKFRKAGKTIGESMAWTSAAQLLSHVVLLTTFQAGNKNLMSTLIMLSIYFAAQGGFKLVEQDGLLEAFKDRDYRRNPDVKKVVFIFYRIGFYILEYIFYLKPLVLLFLDGYDMGTWTQKAA